MEKKITFESLPSVIGEMSQQISELRGDMSALSEQVKRMTSDKKRPPKEIYSTRQVASFLNLSLSSVYKMVNDDVIPYMKKGRKLFFYRDDIMDWLASKSSGTASRR